MAHLNSQAGLAGVSSAVRSRNMHMGGKLPRSNVARRRTREDAKLFRGTGVMFDEAGYAAFLMNMERNDLGCRMGVRSGSHIVVRDRKLARDLDSRTGVAMPLHFKLTGESEGNLALPRDSQWLASAIITTRKGVRKYGARRFRLIARPNVGPALFVVWPEFNQEFEIEGVPYKVISRKRRHHKVAFIEPLAKPESDTNDDLVDAA